MLKHNFNIYSMNNRAFGTWLEPKDSVGISYNIIIWPHLKIFFDPMVLIMIIYMFFHELIKNIIIFFMFILCNCLNEINKHT